MIGNLAEAILTLGMVLLVPGALVLGVVVVRRLAQARRGGAQVPPTHGSPVVYVVGSILIGAAGAFIMLEGYVFGIAMVAATAALLVGGAGHNRWFALGGFLLGMGLCATGLLSGALTNRDPAVRYDPSTIPFFWVGASIALCGAVILTAASAAHPRQGRA